MEEDKLIDQSRLAESVSSEIKYEFREAFLVKPLDPVKVKKEFSKPVSNEAPKKDENGVEAVDYDKVETEVKEVDSDFKRGVVLKIPFSYENRQQSYPEIGIKVGDVIIYRTGQWFDLLKDTQLVRIYDIIGTEKTSAE